MHDDEDEDFYKLTISCILQYCVDPCKPSHRPFVLSAVSKDAFSLELLPRAYRHDREVVTVAVRGCGSALQFASPELKADQAIVLAAIANDPFALEYACKSLRKDPEIVMQAVQRDIATLQLADQSLFSNHLFMLDAVALDPTAVTWASPELLGDQAWRAAAYKANNAVGHYFVSTELFPSLQHEQSALGPTHTAHSTDSQYS